MKLSPAITVVCMLVTFDVSAATLQVGVGRQFTTLGAAARVAQDGDVVDIFPGNYAQGAVWFANNLTLELAPGSKPGSVTIKGTVNRKGVFDIKGDDNIVDGLRFGYATSTDANGAGIRAEGHNITIRNSEFYENEMGVLVTPVVGKQLGDATFDHCVFALNGTKKSGYVGHSIYGNYLGTLTVTNSKFVEGVIGHYIKSRALSSTIHDNVIDDTNGSASYLINIPQGGAANIYNNQMIKGEHATNCCIAVSYGEEMYKGGAFINPPGQVSIDTNIFTNYSKHDVIFVANKSLPANPVALNGNTITAAAGSVTLLVGPGTTN